MAKDGTSEADLNRILARAAAAKTSEYPKEIYPQSSTGGVIGTSIKGRFQFERERLGPDFTENERQWRIKWYRDQHLHPNEPVKAAQEAMQRELLNPLRRLYRIPFDWIEKHVFEPRMGPDLAGLTRKVITRSWMTYVVALFAYYNLKYHYGDWEASTGVHIHHNKIEILPGDPRYPVGFEDARPNPEDYNDKGFKSRKVFRD